MVCNTGASTSLKYKWMQRAIINSTVLWVLICAVHFWLYVLINVTYAFQGESTLYSCLNVKELLDRNRRDTWRLSDCKGTQTHRHLVRKRTLNHSAKLAIWLSCVVSTCLNGAFNCVFLSCQCTAKISTHDSA